MQQAATRVVSAKRPSLPRRPSARLRRGATSVLLLVAAWFAIAAIVDDPLFLAGPADVARALSEDFRSGELLTNIRVSLIEFSVGMVLGIVAGIGLGLVIGASEKVSDYADPFVAASYSAPLIAFAPLLVLWLGIGIWSKVAIVFIVVLFPVLINVASGVRTTSRTLLEVAHAFGASRAKLFRTVLIPANVPAAMAGIRISLGRALVAIVVAELFGAQHGIGYSITQASFTFDTARIFGGVLILMLIGVVLMELIRKAERSVAPWAFRSAEGGDD